MSPGIAYSTEVWFRFDSDSLLVRLQQHQSLTVNVSLAPHERAHPRKDHHHPSNSKIRVTQDAHPMCKLASTFPGSVKDTPRCTTFIWKFRCMCRQLLWGHHTMGALHIMGAPHYGGITHYGGNCSYVEHSMLWKPLQLASCLQLIKGSDRRAPVNQPKSKPPFHQPPPHENKGVTPIGHVQSPATKVKIWIK